MDKMIVTTTDTIENSTIQKYIELISTNVVVGTNIFSDFEASIQDIFGGLSETYQNKLQKIYKVAISNIKEQASLVGANAIIGLKINFDEISGKGKSMFMISAVGMAVFIKSENNQNIISEPEIVSVSQLNKELTKNVIIKLISDKKLLSKEHWIYLLNNPIEEITKDLLIKYLETDQVLNNEKYQLLKDNFTEYISTLNTSFLNNIIYSQINNNNFDKIYDLLKQCNLFDPQKILELIEHNQLKNAIKCLDIEKNYYNKDDLKKMINILEQINSLPNTGKIEVSKDGLLSKEKERFICQNGHKNEVENTFCTSEFCGVDIKGLTKKEYKQIELFKLKIDSLKFLINR